MTFSRRERAILLATVAVLGALMLDRFALTPLLDWSDRVEARQSVLVRKMAGARTVLQRRRVMEPRWRSMIAGGLKGDPGEAESQILHAVGQWAREAGVNLVSLRPERSTEETALPEIDVQVSAAGPMAAVSRFLWRLETADIPVRAKSLQLSARKEGADDLSLQLKISTLYLPGQPASKAASKEARQGGNPPEGEQP